MANHSLNDIAQLINQEIKNREVLDECLHKAHALTEISLGEEFFDFPRLVIHYHLWVISDMLEAAKTMNERALSGLFRVKLS